MKIPQADRDLSNKVAIVGVGESDYGFDYATSRERESPPEYDLADRLALTALERALADSGLSRKDIDAVGFCYFILDYAGMQPMGRADALGLRPKHAAKMIPLMAGVIPEATVALAEKRYDTFALIYSAPMRSVRRAFGGEAENYGPTSYWYYHPWGWSSQAAHWALKCQYYMARFGFTEKDLGAVAVTLRENAVLNENAVMREPITINDYLNSRYVVKPLHLLDMCLVSDAAICIILKRTEDTEPAQAPVLVSGWGSADAEEGGDLFQHMVVEALRPQYQEAARQALDMAGLSIKNVQHFEGYDAASIHLINQIEGYGLVPEGEALGYWQDGYMRRDGQLPVNTAGGMLSEAYTQGWNHVAEAVRQLRHRAGDRQAGDISVAMTSLSDVHGGYPQIFTRGDA
jgi:acetyl-CoA acetyltransferase